MGRKSTIRKLPPELRAELDRLLSDGKLSLGEITDHLKALGAGVSRSAVHRYSQDFERIADDIRMAREMATAIGRELEAVPDGDTGRLVIESLQALLLRARTQLATDPEKAVDIAEFGTLARAAKDLQQALRSNVETELKIRDRVAREAANVAEDVAVEKGLSAETVAAIKERILGIRKAA